MAITDTRTIGSELDRHRGIAPGFDLLRICLAIGVVAWHTDAVVTGATSEMYWFVWLPGYAILAAFFGLSGFLIAASGLRLTLKNFLINRGLRIIPALAVEVILCMLLLGPLFTQLSIKDYLSNPRTWFYTTNIVGLIHFQLPGVFYNHPTNIVNNSLWTVPQSPSGKF